jgi:hypothetical protein
MIPNLYSRLRVFKESETFVKAGHNGLDYVADTAAHVGPYTSIVAMTTAVANIVMITPNGGPNANAAGGHVDGYPNLNSVNLGIGVPFEGSIASFTLASGSVVAYRGN